MTTRLSRRESVKDSIKKALHLPRERYIPLPVGGYPLPDIMKRKFAPPPQLPDVNRLSLMPDFTSSLYGEQWSEALQNSLGQAKPRRPGTPNSSDTLRVRYSILVPDEPTNSGPLQIPCMIREIPTKTHTLRRVNGRENLKSSRNRSITSPTVSEGSALNRTSSISQSSDIDDINSESTLVASEPRAEYLKAGTRPGSNTSMDSVETLIYIPVKAKSDQSSLTMVIEYVPHLLSSFCILDLQISGHPIRVTTFDLVPQDSIAEGEALFLDDSDLEKPWEIQTIGSGESQTHHVLIEGDLIDSSGVLSCASHRFTGQLDVTNLINILEVEPDPEVPNGDIDVWLEIAHEEMDRLGIQRTIRDVPKTNSASASLQKDRALQALKDLHKNYFIMGFSSAQTRDYAITHLSPSLAASMSQGNSNPLECLFDVEALTDTLSNGERFVARTVAEGSDSPKRLYCLPMFGPELGCWLCFLVDGSLPNLWQC